MTISSTNRKAGPFIGNDSTTACPFAFKVFSDTDLLVVRLNVSTGVETTLVLNTDYTVARNSNQDSNPGGTINLSSAIATGYTVTVTTSVAELQPTDLTNQGGFFPKVVTTALDRLTVLIQQLSEKMGRSLKIPLSAPAGVSTDLPFPESNKLLGWNAMGDGLQNIDGATLATIVAFGTAVPDLFTGDGSTTQFVLSKNPGALGNLDVAIGGVTQRPTVDYTWTAGTTITFTSAPPAPSDGAANILVRYIQALPQGYADSAAVTFSQTASSLSRTVSDKLREIEVSLSDYPGADPTGASFSDAAMSAALAAYSSGVRKIRVPKGTWKFSGGFNLSGLNGLKIIGEGRGATTIDLSHATNDLFYTGAIATYRLELRGFTVTSSVIRTTGWVFNIADAYNSTGGLGYSDIQDIEITSQVNGLCLSKFQFVTLRDITGYRWVGSGGIGIKAGQATATDINQGAELKIIDSDIYGNDPPGGSPVLSYGLWVEDCEAVNTVRLGIGGCAINDLYLKSNSGGHPNSNHAFGLTTFDATKNSDCIQFDGNGIFSRISFFGCWIASAGQQTGGSAEACGVNLKTGAVYDRISLVGGTIYNCKGSGLKVAPGVAGSILVQAMQIISNGSSATTNKYGVWLCPSTQVSTDFTLVGCKLANTTGDFVYTANALDVNVSGCSFAYGVTYPAANGSACFGGNYDKSSTTIASATRITPRITCCVHSVTGTTNIAGIDATFAGHTIVLKFSASLTVISASQNIQLNSNFSAVSGSALTLVCDGVTWFEVGRKT